MFFELIAAIVAGIAAAGVVLLLNKLSGGRLPRWLAPVTAGIAMIAFTIRMEYTWFDRTTADFPESVAVISTHEARGPLRPWTILFPLVDRFVAVETDAVRTNPAVPDQRMADMMFFARWQNPRVSPVVLDCAARRVAPLLDTVTYDADGAVVEADWAAVPADDPAFMALCSEVRP